MTGDTKSKQAKCDTCGVIFKSFSTQKLKYCKNACLPSRIKYQNKKKAKKSKLST